MVWVVLLVGETGVREVEFFFFGISYIGRTQWTRPRVGYSTQILMLIDNSQETHSDTYESLRSWIEKTN